MAQSTKTTKSSNSRGGARRKATGSSRSSTAKRSKSSSSRSSSNGRRTKGASGSRSGSSAQSRNGAGSITDTAIDKAKTTGRAAADAASKARTPLIAGGTALVGAAVGAVMKSRLGASNGKKNPLKRLGRSKPVSNLGKLDLDTVKTLATQMKAYGQQATDIADAVEKTRKKN